MQIYPAHIKVMIDAATKAARGLIRDFGEVENLQVSKKGPGDFVSQADLRADKRIREMLAKARPDYAILTEESGETPGNPNSPFRWIVDPLDGTSNFLHGIPYFCIAIALEKSEAGGRREPVAGVILDVIHNDIYWAEKGQGAFQNNRRLRVSGRERMEDALFTAEFVSIQHRGDTSHLSRTLRVGAQCSAVRATGSAALDLAYVAAGKYDGMWRSKTYPWDVAAGTILIREAGGTVTEIGGGENPLHGGTIVATNRLLHKSVDQLLTQA